MNSEKFRSSNVNTKRIKEFVRGSLVGHRFIKVWCFVSTMWILRKDWLRFCVSAGVCRLAVKPADGPVQPSQTEVSQRYPPTGAAQWRLWGVNRTLSLFLLLCFSYQSFIFYCKHTNSTKTPLFSAVVWEPFFVYAKREASPIRPSFFANRL